MDLRNATKADFVFYTDGISDNVTIVNTFEEAKEKFDSYKATVDVKNYGIVIRFLNYNRKIVDQVFLLHFQADDTGTERVWNLKTDSFDKIYYPKK